MSQDVVDLILQDHRELERLFDLLLTQPDTRPTLVPVMTALLTAHSRAEESEVYPAAREAGDAEDVEHSQREHLEAEILAEKVAATDPAAPEFEKLLRSLIDGVNHHVGEEEKTVLPSMRQHIDAQRRIQLGEDFLAARGRHLGEQPGEATKASLEQQAVNAGIAGASSMSKTTLKTALEDEAEL